MEKLVSVLWKPEGQRDGEFAAALLGEASELAGRGASRLRISVVDDDVASGARLRIGRMDPPSAAIVGYWLDEADDRTPIEQALAGVASRVSSFLVVESEPLRNTTRVAPLGERTPGFNLVTGIVPKQGMPYPDFVRYWHTIHRATALETQSTFAYVRNEIVRAFDPDAPEWVAIVEEGFPEGALTDPRVFYAAEDEATFKRHSRRMLECVQGFLDLDRLESHPTSEYVFAR
jgi:hypothetical protein